MKTVYLENVFQSVDIHSKRLVGEVMNLMEASLEDTSSTIALKKSIKQAIWRSSRNIQNDMNSTIIE
mgnify:CR=1 FL=1|tara:strand:- start:1073 stop:1273 length:201 start_codon:yes stop_codon:yes gene_type:complete